MLALGEERAGLYTSLDAANQDSLSYPSKKATISQRCSAGIAYDQVVQKSNIDQFKGRFQPAGDAFIRLAWLGDAGRMIVSENQYTVPMVSNNVPAITKVAKFMVFYRPALSLDIPKYCGYPSGYFHEREKSCL